MGNKHYFDDMEIELYEKAFFIQRLPEDVHLYTVIYKDESIVDTLFCGNEIIEQIKN